MIRDVGFEVALQGVLGGQRWARAGWNGAGMYVYLVPGSEFVVNRLPLLGILDAGTEVNYRPHVDIRWADGTFGVWQPTVTDLLATDWLPVSDDTPWVDLPAASFVFALPELIKGKRIAREGWNGKGMWLESVNPYLNPYFTVMEKAPMPGKLTPMLFIKTACGQMAPACVTQNDLLANDWVVL